MSDESIKFPVASNNCLAPALNYVNIEIQLKLNGSFLRQEEVNFTHKIGVNTYIVYEINLWQFTVGKDFALRNFLFGVVVSTTNLILISINILVMVLNLMHVEVFRNLMVVGLVRT